MDANGTSRGSGRRVLIAGATGVVGRVAAPLLRQQGFDVVGLARSRRRAPGLTIPVLEVDALDAAQLTEAVRSVRPDTIVHLLTAIPSSLEPRRFATQMDATNRLRAQATATLVRAAPDARLVTASVAFLYRPPADQPVREGHPLWDDAPTAARAVVAAVKEAERITAQANGVVLRFGHLYGPGTHFARDGSFVAEVARRGVPVVGDGSTFSFLHVDDAATAVAAALRSNELGAFNIVDDDPAPTSEWLPELARLLGAPAPRRAPRLVARIVGGAWGAAWSAQLVGADNDRARRILGWAPSRPTWREGFAELLGRAPAAGSGRAGAPT